VRLFLEAGADPNAADAEGNPPLRSAVERGHREVVSALLAAGADPRFVGAPDGRSLLPVAALYGHGEIAGLLLASGVDVSRADGADFSPLYYAARYGHGRLADRLLAAGAQRSEVGEEHTHPSPYLSGGKGEAEVVGWYLSNRGMALKTPGHLLVFDPEEFGVTRPTEPGLANGFLTPSEIGGQDVLVFYSAYHGYVDEPAYIHTIADSLKSVTYLHNEGDAFRGSDRALFLSPREAREVGGIPFSTAGAMNTMPTLSYLMEVDGLGIYYQGFGADDLDYHDAELDYLAASGTSIDLALLAIPDAGVQEAEACLRVFFQRFQPKAVALHTPPYRFSSLPEAVEMLRALGYEGEIFFPENPGDMFVMRR
jgi:hypothetical protein